jgi:hypothetical protein
MHRRHLSTLTLAGLLALGATAACGGDDAQVAASTTAIASVAPTVADAAAPSTATAPAPAPGGTRPTPTTSPAPTTPPAPTTVAVVEPGPLELVTRDYQFVGMPAVLRAGAYHVSVRNEGAEAHEFVLYRPTTGKSLEELAAIGPAGFLEHAELAGYLPEVPPGETLPTDVTLSPGEWTLVCFLPAAHDQQPHFAHGMTQTVTVVP